MTGTLTAACVFCERIGAGRYDHSDQFSVAFEPLNPVTPGHMLVVPRTHVRHALSSPTAAGRAMTYAGFLASQLGIGAANFITSAGAPATQSIFHLHVHIVPRRDGDGLALPWAGHAG